MILPVGHNAAFDGQQRAHVCADCGAQAHGNFCSTCGADLNVGRLGILGAIAAPARRSFPVLYLRILRAPVRETVALTEDPTYRGQVSFLLTGIAIFCLLFLPILLQSAVPAEGAAHLSDSMQTMLKLLSQVGVYVGTVIGFLVAYGLFRIFAREPRTVRAYFKLYCLAFGFVTPLYAAYEFLTRTLLHGTGMSSYNAPMTQAEQLTPTALASVALLLVLWAYFIAIHSRFWRMPLWKGGVLYVISATASYQLSFWLMVYVRILVGTVLIAYGIVTV